MAARFTALAFGAGFGFVLAWAGLSDPRVIWDMLLLREFDVFLLMGSGIALSAVGVRLLRARGVKAFVTREPVAWATARPASRNIVGSVLFGAGWSLAGTCPAPAATMIGQGRLGGLVVAAGLLAGVVLQRGLVRGSAVSAICGDEQDVAGF